MQTEKIQFTKEKETMLVTLYGRALDSQSKGPILRDPAAEEAIQHIDYDFRALNVKWNDILAIAARAKVFDLWATEYLAKEPNAVVLHLGCGLDSRVYRIRAGKLAPGVAQLFVPGEPEWRRRESANGIVKLESAVAGNLIKLAQDLKVSAEPLLTLSRTVGNKHYA